MFYINLVILSISLNEYKKNNSLLENQIRNCFKKTNKNYLSTTQAKN